MEEGQEVGDEVDVGDVVCGELKTDVAEVNGLWLGEVEAALNAGVEEYTVKARMGFCDSVILLVSQLERRGGDVRFHEVGDPNQVRDVELE